jgi:hypothetical protein
MYFMDGRKFRRMREGVKERKEQLLALSGFEPDAPDPVGLDRRGGFLLRSGSGASDGGHTDDEHPEEHGSLTRAVKSGFRANRMVLVFGVTEDPDRCRRHDEYAPPVSPEKFRHL